MSPTFSSLGVRNYRVYATGAFVSNIGTWMGRVAQDWLVLTELTNHSSSALGIVTGLQFLPFLLLAPWAGMIADRYPKRRILAVTQTSLALSSLVLGLLVVTGTAQLWMVYGIALFTGIATAVDNPARQTFVSEMVPRDRLANAVSLNSASFNAGRLIGPGVAGLTIAGFGTGWTLMLNTLTFVAVLLALASMRRSELRPAPALARGKGAIREGVAYVRSRPDIQLVMLLVFVLGTFGMNFQITTALMATKEFGKGPEEYGLLGSIMAIGSLTAALLSARRAKPRLRILLVALVGFTLSTGLAAVAPSYPLFALSLVPVGLSALTALTTANAMVQLSVDPAMRGRVMALYMAIFMGGTPLGAPLIGWIGDVSGPRWTIAIGTIAVGLTLVVVSIWTARHENVQVSYESQRRPRLRIRTLPQPEVSEPVPEVAR
ncbi:Predicted arabinose efflux permease, MFS family [Pedococcus dokdonensis]|uniref:Predicted arabinose efflux permease, MFS family n=1 Tax=Pedococcus dokdonensis TaxID=443156 RepID=A0A1H0SKV9_9MICO|nr:MFS transporter [Pedococcus dokdonensis]SDP42472.1 Predicted arabinose efflux permease, MFS family [Pedococcus dokdonensis]